MQIVCPSCATAYRIEISTLGMNGRLVRCVRCKNVWFASLDAVSATPEASIEQDAEGSRRAPDSARRRDSAPSAMSAAAEHSADDTTRDSRTADWTVDATSDAPDAAPSPVVVSDAPSLVPAVAQDATSVPGQDRSGGAGRPDIETLAARLERVKYGPQRARTKWRMPQLSVPGLPAMILVLVGVLAAIVHWRMPVVRVLPQTASLFATIGLPVNLRGLHFDDLKTSVEFHDGIMVLVLEGAIINVATKAVEVPRLRFAMRNPAGFEVYAWTALPTQSVLGAGDSVRFRTRLASPPADGRDLIVRFFNRRDALAGLR